MGGNSVWWGAGTWFIVHINIDFICLEPLERIDKQADMIWGAIGYDAANSDQKSLDCVTSPVMSLAGCICADPCRCGPCPLAVWSFCGPRAQGRRKKQCLDL